MGNAEDHESPHSILTLMKRLPHLAPNDWIGPALVLAGFILRLRQYLVNRSLWLDEAMLSVNIVSRSFSGLSGWLDYDQQAPIGFLWLQKALVVGFGDNELVLRLIPFLAGCIALWLMYMLTRWLPPIGGNTALALFVVSSTLVYYTSESKQYIVDVMIGLGLLMLFLHLDRRGMRPRDCLLLGTAGAITIWFSHPAIFILAGLGLIIVVKAWREKRFPGWTFLTGVLWLGSFAVFYHFFLGRSVTAKVLLDYWGDAFLPLSTRAGSWLIQSFNSYFTFSLGLEIPLLVGFVIALPGLVILVHRNRYLAAALVLPILFTLGASIFHVYPFAGRMLLFTSPAFFILLGEGIETPILLLKRSSRVSAWISGLLATALVLSNIPTTAQNFVTPKSQEHIRPTMEYLRIHHKPGDLVYVYFWAEPAVRFYAPKYGFAVSDFIFGADHHEQPELYHAELDALRGHARVWVLFSHVYENGDFNERDYILEYLDSIGSLSREVRAPGTSVYLYLYDLQTPASK